MSTQEKQPTGKERAAAKKNEDAWDPIPRPMTPTPASEEKTTWYQCVDLPNFWSKDGHKSFRQDGVSAVDAVLNDPDNEGALMITFQDNRSYTIRDGTMLPAYRDGTPSPE